LFFALFAVALLLGWNRISFSNDRTRLLDNQHPAQMRFEQWRKSFGANPEIVILVHGESESERRMALQRLEEEMQKIPQLESVNAFLDLPDLPTQGLYYLGSEPLRKLETQLLAQSQVFVSGKSMDLSQMPKDEAVRQQLLNALKSRGRTPYESPFGERPPQLQSRLELSLNSQTSVLVANAPEKIDAFATLKQLRSALKEVRHDLRGVKITLGGDFVALTDDAQNARWSALQAACISVFLVHFFFRWSFGQARPPRLALITVLVALGWTCAWVAVACPTLNIITINFACTMVGLGMDFNVQMLYDLEERVHKMSPQQALVESLSSIGQENLLGALATSAAFLSLTLTPFRGVSELGLISGVGVLLCWIASCSVLPALWLLKTPTPVARPPGTLEAMEQKWRSHPKAVLTLALLITAISLAAAWRPKFDYNLLNILAKDSAAAQIDAAFHEQAGSCSLYAVSIAHSEEEMRQRVKLFRKMPSVARVESAADWIPDAYEIALARPIIERVLRQARSLQLPPQPPKRLSTEELLQMQRASAAGSNWPELDAVLKEAGPGPIQDGLSYFLGQLHRDVEERLQWLKKQKLDPAPGWERINPELLARYRNPDGEWLIKIYARQDVWDKANLQEFQAQIGTVDPQATGLPQLTLAYLEQVHSSYWSAGRNALAAITVLLILYFRRIDRALLALAPKLLGMLWMLGAMGWMGVDFNPANATALPLTLGIGLVFGVHVMHQAIRQPGKLLFAGPTGRAVAVSGLSTVLGYASLMTTTYRGMSSLGLVMAVGIVSNLVTSLVILPVVLDRFTRTSTVDEPAARPPDEPRSPEETED